MRLHTARHLSYGVRRLSHASLPVGTAELARYLIGKTIVRNKGRKQDEGPHCRNGGLPAGRFERHAYGGQTARNHSLFLGAGFAYVYFIYGTSFMLNVTAEQPGVGAGVLLRARNCLMESTDEAAPQNRQVTDLARGPGRLAAALQIDERLDGLDLRTDGPLWLGTPVQKSAHIGKSVRIGITREAGKLLRFFEVGNPFVSGPKA